jgi:glucan 1,3-beta-glucosidase
LSGDGIADDTAAIQQAMTANSSCLNGICPAGTTTPAVVYFPAGTYLISSSIFPSYMTQIIGNPNDMPVLKAVATFNDSHLIDGDFIPPTGEEYKPTDIFYRQIRNLILDLTEIPDRHSINGVIHPRFSFSKH